MKRSIRVIFAEFLDKIGKERQTWSTLEKKAGTAIIGAWKLNELENGEYENLYNIEEITNSNGGTMPPFGFIYLKRDDFIRFLDMLEAGIRHGAIVVQNQTGWNN